VDLGGVELNDDEAFGILLAIVDRRGKDFMAQNAAFWDGRDVFVGGVKV
jgi:hypothetical protein